MEEFQLNKKERGFLFRMMGGSVLAIIGFYLLWAAAGLFMLGCGVTVIVGVLRAFGVV